MYSFVSQRTLCRETNRRVLVSTYYRNSQIAQVQNMWYMQGPSRVYTTKPTEQKPIIEQAKEKIYKNWRKNRSSQSHQ